MKVIDVRPLMLIRDGRTLLKVSTVYTGDHVSAQVLIDRDGTPPSRTTVRHYDALAIARWTEPTRRLMALYEKHWQRAS